MKAKHAKKLVSSLAASAVLLSVFAACDLGLTPYVAPVDGGPQVLFDSGNTVVDTGAADSGSDAGSDAGDAGGGPKRVFVTSIKLAGDFNGQHGQAGADAVCQSLATAAKLNGRFVSWISEAVVGKDAIDHVADVGPWYLPDRKTLVFATKASITASNPMKAISTDENGNDLGVFDSSRVWTGTLSNGRVGGAAGQATCADWTVGIATNATGVSGDPGSKNQDWTQKFTEICTQSNRLYCFEQ